ncbi:hypothetical protein V6C03_01995 [Methyloligella sp. 2.7D]|uniref:hypothetical protein n=1 Tax=unclassified Methyloligella TaxID=2625955 RepID=UPI00157C24B8|nr:hypothetical protein [Methyloligella sp. GL2]QKP76590.1 hypothetical protein HT051_03425 [Methyloligella sp. GL2]
MGSQIQAALIAAIVSAVVTVGGWFVTYWTQDRALQVKMVEIAVGILRAEPKENIRPAREWAVDVISEYSYVPLKPEVQRALLEHRVDVGGYDVYDYSPPGLGR